MNAAHYHLLINHVPILATYFSLAILIWGMATQNETIKKVAMAGFVVAGLFVIVAYQTGLSAEEVVEDIPGITHAAIEAHEEAASVAEWLTILLGVFGAAGYYLVEKGKKKLRVFSWIILIFGIITAGSLAYTAYKGGFIRHPEISNNSTQVQGQGVERDDD